MSGLNLKLFFFVLVRTMKRFSFCDNIIKYHLLNVIGSNLLNDEGVADLCFAVLSNQSVTCNKQESFKTFFFM